MMTECPQCHNQFDASEQNVGERLGMKLGGALFGSVLGGVTRRTWGVLLGVVVGAALGQFLERKVMPFSPTAQAAFKLLGQVV
jgi:outer membrane lipoprotein SlyB